MLQTHQTGPITYQISDTNPQLLLITGTHGDEYEVILSVKKAIKKYQSHLPPYLFIPEFSPSAVQLKTRSNARGIDMNRNFNDHAEDPEVKAIRKIVAPHHFSLCITFHEDPELDLFYLYDSQVLPKDKLSELKEAIQQTGVGLFDGIDDPHDPVLGFLINDGYISLPLDTHEPQNQTFWGWGLRKNIFKRIFNPEIPGKISQDKKDALTSVLFEQLIIPYFNSHSGK